MKRTPERAAALLYCAYLRTENAPFIAREVYRTLVKPFPRRSPEVVALRRIAELADTRYERLDHDTICKCGEIAKEIARGWK